MSKETFTDLECKDKITCATNWFEYLKLFSTDTVLKVLKNLYMSQYYSSMPQVDHQQYSLMRVYSAVRLQASHSPGSKPH